MKHQATYAATCMVKQSHCEGGLIQTISKQLEMQAKMYAEIERDTWEIESRLKFADKRTLDFNPDVANLKRKKTLLAEARGES